MCSSAAKKTIRNHTAKTASAPAHGTGNAQSGRGKDSGFWGWGKVADYQVHEGTTATAQKNGYGIALKTGEKAREHPNRVEI